MVKRFPRLELFLLSLVLGACGNNNLRYEPDREPDRRVESKLKGPVEVFRETTYIMARESLEIPDTIETSVLEVRYDTSGRILNQEKYRNDELVEMFVYNYDTAGRRTEYQEFDAGGRLKLTRVKVFGKNGKLEEEQDFGAEGKLLNKFRYTYDGQNRVLTSRFDSYSQGRKGRETNTYESRYSYDGDGQYTVEELRNGQLTMKSVYENSRLSRWEKYDPEEGNLVQYAETQWSEGGKRSREVQRDQEGKVLAMKEWLSGPHGLEMDRYEGPDSALVWLKLMKYNSDGEITEMRFFANPPGGSGDTSAMKPAVTRYSYANRDPYGNWGQARSYENDSLLTVVKLRKFIYFQGK